MNKYHNKRTQVDNLMFASKKEAQRYRELALLQRAGKITDLCMQVPYPLVVNGQLVCRYVADFTYTDREGRQHVEDAKGVVTQVYRLKRKLMKAVYDVVIEEV